MGQNQVITSLLKNSSIKLLCFFIFFYTTILSAHPLPDTKLMFFVFPRGAAIHISAPLRDFEIVYKGKINETENKQILNYFKNHLKINTERRIWDLELKGFKISRTKDSIVGLYDKIDFEFIAIPLKKEDTRSFTLDYNAFVHEIYTHKTIVSLGSDWESGVQNSQQILGVIERDVDGKIQPLNISLEEGNFFLGFKSMIIMGFYHILEGTDHILFLISLLLVAPFFMENKKWKIIDNKKLAIKRVIKIVTAFTIGHSIMLVLGAIKFINIEPNYIEIGIAITILLSGINIYKPIFWGKEEMVALFFGFIHGLAFANTISFFNLDVKQFFWSVFGFNLGIELVQILIVIVTFPIILLLFSKHQKTKLIRLFATIIVVTMAIFWLYERLLGKTT